MTWRRILIKNCLIILPLKVTLLGVLLGMLLYFYLTILNLNTPKEAMVGWIGFVAMGVIFGLGMGIKMFWAGIKLEKKTNPDHI